MRCLCSMRLASSCADAFTHGRRDSVRHQFETCVRIAGEAYVAIGENADQLAGDVLARTGDDGNRRR